MKKKIVLIGLNLYSAFLALQIKSNSKYDDITIIEGSNNFINAYKSVKIKNYNLNPGFHALENIRSKKLINLLSKEIKFKKLSKTRGLIIGKNLISYLSSYNQWPESILSKFDIKKKKVKLNPLKNINFLNINYLRYLTDNYLGKEHSISDAISTSYPWFFPPNYDLLSNDEATLFNKKIRDKNLKHAFVFPKKGHFSEISKALKIMLKKKNISVKLNKPIKFYKIKNKILFEGYRSLNNPNIKKIICIPVKPLNDSIKKKIYLPKLKPIKYFTGLIEIRNFIKNDLDKFCEIIVSSENAFGLRRVSQYSEIFNIKRKKIYQIEFTQHSKEKDIDLQINKIILLLANFITFKNKKNTQNIKLIGYSWVRNIFTPNKKYIEKLTMDTTKFFKNNKNIIYPRQITWPINSNKHLLYSEEDYSKKIIKFLND
tara:strand:+ start:1307 stop:2593 length:1287 start_codon:yes stop_codon:yes gene_type:complete